MTTDTTSSIDPKVINVAFKSGRFVNIHDVTALKLIKRVYWLYNEDNLICSIPSSAVEIITCETLADKVVFLKALRG